MEQIVIPQVTESDDAGLLIRQGQRALHEEGNLHASRHWFDRAFRAAERDDDLEAMAQAAIGLGGLWVYEHHSTEPWAQVLSRQHQTLDRLDPDSALSLQLRARLAAEADYQAGRSSQIFELLQEARRRGDARVLASTLSLAHHCVLGPEHGRLRQALADELLLTATRTEYPSDRLMGLLWKTVDLFLDGSPHGERSLTELTLANANQQHQAIEFTIEAMQVMLAVRAGDFDRAEAMAAQCLLTGQSCGDIDAIAWYQVQLTSIRWFQGRVGELMPMIRQQVNAPDRGSVDNSQFAALAAMAALDGDYRLAEGALARIGRGDLTQVRPSSGWLGTLHGAVEAAFLIGDADIAAGAYSLLLPFAGLPVMASLAVTCFGSVEHALGLASLTVGEIDRAVTHLQQSVRQNLALGHWPAACLSRYRLAEALAARGGEGDAEQAARHLAGARREATDLKMTLPQHKPAVSEAPVEPPAGDQPAPGTSQVLVRLLGPVDLSVAGTIRPVSGLRRKAVLAVLALHIGEVVSAGHLIDVVWGEHAPLTATNTLQSHISHLRRVLGHKSAIRSQSTGYILDLDGEATDVVTAERLIRDAGTTTDLAHRASHLRAAIELWRGRALMDVAGPVRLDEQAERLNQLLLQAKQTLAEVRLALGQHLEVVEDLEVLTREYPLHEPIHGQLMLALYRAGRQGDALAVYRRLRSSLSDDLGLDPSQPVRSLEQAILRQDASLNR
jgi:DNA-binding SARP family transcriptional activator